MTPSTSHRCLLTLCLAAFTWGCYGVAGLDQTGQPQTAVADLSQPSPGGIRALSNREYLTAVSDILGIPLSRTLIADWSPNPTFSGFDSIQWASLDTKSARDRLATAEKIAALAVASPVVMTCTATLASAVDYAVCAKSIVERIATRAFRRPLRPDELTALKAAYDATVTLAKAVPITAPSALLKEGVFAALTNVLLSPQLIVRGELPPDPLFQGERALDAYELATRLSFLLTGTVPDDELWALAERGALTDPDVLTEQAERLLSTASDRFVATFFAQWLDVRALEAAADGTLEKAMWTETNLTLRELMRAELPAVRFLDPGFTFVNRQLATHYGLSGAPETGFGQVATHERGGVLMQGSVLTATSTPLKTSPIRRGRWVQGRILCKTLALPGPELFERIAQVAESIPDDATVKERMDLHRNADPICQSCHQYMDPIGLGLEGFDQQGKKRTLYDGDPTRPVETDSTLLGTPFQTFEELNALLTELPEVERCIAEKLAIFTLGRVVSPAEADKPLIDFLAQPEAGVAPSVRQLVHRILQSNAFRTVTHARSAP